MFNYHFRHRFELLEPRHLLTDLILQEQPLIATTATVHEVIDLDGDADLDVVFQLAEPSTIRYQWLENIDGNGNWGPLSELPGIQDQAWVKFGDVDGDGDKDVIHRSDQHFSWRAFENGDFGPPKEISFTDNVTLEDDRGNRSVLHTWELVDYDNDDGYRRFLSVKVPDGVGGHGLVRT